jgi:hypothetical protein
VRLSKLITKGMTVVISGPEPPPKRDRPVEQDLQVAKATPATPAPAKKRGFWSIFGFGKR